MNEPNPVPVVTPIEEISVPMGGMRVELIGLWHKYAAEVGAHWTAQERYENAKSYFKGALAVMYASRSEYLHGSAIQRRKGYESTTENLDNCIRWLTEGPMAKPEK